MTEDQRTPVGTSAGTGRSQGSGEGPHVRRPDEHIQRPRLRVKRKEGREGAAPKVRRAPEAPPPEEPQQPAPEAQAAAPVKIEAPAAAQPAEAGPPRHVPPPAGDDDPRFRYATYRAAPADEPASKWSWLTGLFTRDGGREISTGFVLGVALVVVILIGGIWLARLGNKVGRLEQRLTQLEQGSVATADAGETIP